MQHIATIRQTLQTVVILLYFNSGMAFSYDYNMRMDFEKQSSCEKKADIVTVNNEEVLLRLDKSLPGMISCFVMSPTRNLTFPGEDDEYQEKDSQNNVMFWGNTLIGDCGIRIKNISQGDKGTWMLTSISEDGKEVCQYFIIDVTYVSISDKNFKVAPGSEISWDSRTSSVAYCYILKPDGTPYDELYSDNCMVDIDAVYMGDVGTWMVMIGYLGKTDEVLQKVNVDVEEMLLETGMIADTSDSGAVNLYCNMKSSFYIVTACSFKRPGDKAAYRMTEGVGNGNYTYFGNGIDVNECGITILQPTDVDYGSWECSLITTFNNGDKAVTAYITMENENSTKEKGFQIFTQGSNHITLLVGNNASIFCKIDWSLRGCTLLSPSGDLFPGDIHYINSGWCRSQVMEIKADHNGKWKCYMTSNIGLPDFTETVDVTVTNNLISAEKSTVYVALGEMTSMLCQSLIKNTSFSYCWFKDPSGLLIDVRADIWKQYTYYGAGIEYGDCGIEIKHVGPQHIGKWICMAAVEGEQHQNAENSINLQLSDTTTSIFPSYLESEEGITVTLKLLHDFKSLNRCILTTPDGSSFELQPMQPVHINSGVEAVYSGAGYQYGGCGVCISGLTSTKSYDIWHLSAANSIGSSIQGLAFVRILAATEMKKNWKKVEVQVGSNATLTCGENVIKDYCIFMGPIQGIANEISGSCSIHLSPVTKLHLGNWTCLIGVPHKIQEFKEVITVTDMELQLSVTVDGEATNLGSVNMHCTIPRSISFCRFKLPSSDTAFVLFPGVVAGNYKYDGIGLNYGDCGLHISSISNTDIGSWQCSVGWEENGTSIFASAIITLGSSFNGSASNKEKDVLAVVGSRLEIKWYVNVALAYCWIHHPNGSQIVPEQNEESLSLGECSLSIDAADYSDSGLWMCHLGNKYSPGEELTISRAVIISETRLSAEKRGMEATIGSTVFITCKSAPQGASLDYCRFVRSDGINIPAIPGTIQGRYHYYGDGLERGDCGLQINNIQNEDIGIWICAAQLQDDKSEAADSVRIVKRGLSIAAVSGIVATITLVLIVGVVGGVWAIRRWRNHSVQNVAPVLFSDLLDSASQSETSSYVSSSNNSD